MFDAQMMMLGVVGNPIRHSRSPQIHQFFARQHGHFIDYRRIYAEQACFETVAQRFFSGGGLGLNITLPFKGEAAMFASELSERAQLVGVVNTLKKTQNGIYGDTTDGQGFIDDVQRLSAQDVFQGGVLILGAGGAVRGLLPDVLAQNPPRVVILNRTRSRALGLVEEVESWRDQLGFSTELVGGGYELDLSQFEFSLLVQGTSGDFEFKWAGDLSQTFCYDLNYGERAAGFFRWAQGRGAAQVHDGLGMLVGQAAASFALWTGDSPDIEATMNYLRVANPWLEDWWQPPFNDVDLVQLSDAVVARLQEKEHIFEQRLQDIASGLIPLNWDSFVRCYEEANDRLMRVWSVMGHLNDVLSSDKLRASYNQLALEISDHFICEQHNPLYKSTLQQLIKSPVADTFTQAQQKWCSDTLRNFKLTGSDLRSDEQKQYAQLENELTELESQFSDLLLDATEAWFVDVFEAELVGMPSNAIQATKEAYASACPESQESLCRLTLKEPCYVAVMSYCENLDIRKKMYEAGATTASDEGPHAGLYDTSHVIKKTLMKRHQQATLLGFEDYAAFSLSTKMAESSEQVVQFLEGLADRVKPQAESEYEALKQFAAEKLKIEDLQPWDISFVAEKLKLELFSLDSDLIREYFPTSNVLQGLFSFVEKFFNVSCRIDYGVPTYHEDVQFVELSNDKGIIGGLYIDLYAREKKQGGAWMDVCRQRYITAEGLICNPIAYLVCNAASPTDDRPSLMSHEDVVTLFHEMGHCLHHVLTQVDIAGLSGTEGVEWDAIEIPSQLLEGWCYREEVLPLLSAHYATGQQLPRSELEKIIAAKNFQSGLCMVKQVEKSLFDLYLHSLHLHPKGEQALADKTQFLNILRQVQEKVSVIPVPEWHRFANGFDHIFAGGYAAGYYGYIWAEVYSADIFSEFKRTGVFNLALARCLLEGWFAVGGVRSALDNFRDFMGRDVDLKALLDDLGIDELTNPAVSRP